MVEEKTKTFKPLHPKSREVLGHKTAAVGPGVSSSRGRDESPLIHPDNLITISLNAETGKGLKKNLHLRP